MFQAFQEFFQTIVPERILITTHENADPDALCSAFALKHLIESLYPETKVTIRFNELSLLTQQIVNKFNLDIQMTDDLTNDGIIIVDASHPEQLGDLKDQINLEVPILIVDHHNSHIDTEKITKYIIINEESIATSEIIFEIYQTFNVQLSQIDACLICLGILYDSRHLLLANNKTIKIIHQLLNYGIDYSDMIELLTFYVDRSERIARLKAAQRVTLYEFDKWIVAVSHVSTYEASACRALMSLGADIALVYGEKKDEIRFSARATSEVIKKTNLNLARDVMEKIGVIMEGEGGGHEGAAGCTGKTNLEAGLQMALELLKLKLTVKS